MRDDSKDVCGYMFKVIGIIVGVATVLYLFLLLPFPRAVSRCSDDRSPHEQLEQSDRNQGNENPSKLDACATCQQPL